MAILQARLDRYRAELGDLGDAAFSFVDEFIRAIVEENPGISVAELREEAIGAVDSALHSFGDQASELALDLFEEIVVREHGIDADARIEDAIPAKMMDDGVRYAARKLVEGDTDAFRRDVADLSRYYVKRSAFENMERNCHRNDLRYARVPSGRETCSFCFMLSSRGFVYRSEQTAGHAHAYHENCDCVVVPGFKDLPASEQIEGYDPDGMYERWSECRKAAGSDSDFRAEWERMDGTERAKYKGNNESERFRRFANAKVMREIETRDWRWLYTGEIPKVDYVKPRVELESHERAGVDWLRGHGYAIETIPEDPKAAANLDLSINGELWEMKNTTNAHGSVGNQMVRARKKFYKNPGLPKRYIITCEGNAEPHSRVVEAVKTRLRDGEVVMVVGCNGELAIVKK